MSKTFLFQFSQAALIQTVLFSISMPWVLFNPLIGPYQVLPFWAKVNLGAMALKRCSTLPKVPASLDCLASYTGHSLGGLTPLFSVIWGGLDPLFSVIYRTLMVGLPRGRGVVGVFYSPSQLGKLVYGKNHFDSEKKYLFWGNSKWQQIRVLQVWTEVCHEVFGGWEVQTMWCVRKSMF